MEVILRVKRKINEDPFEAIGNLSLSQPHYLSLSVWISIRRLTRPNHPAISSEEATTKKNRPLSELLQSVQLSEREEDKKATPAGEGMTPISCRGTIGRGLIGVWL